MNPNIRTVTDLTTIPASVVQVGTLTPFVGDVLLLEYSGTAAALDAILVQAGANKDQQKTALWVWDGTSTAPFNVTSWFGKFIKVDRDASAYTGDFNLIETKLFGWEVISTGDGTGTVAGSAIGALNTISFKPITDFFVDPVVVEGNVSDNLTVLEFYNQQAGNDNNGADYVFENGLTKGTGTIKLGGELTEKTEIKTGADNWIAFGEIMDEQWGLVIGDLTDFDNQEQSLVGVFNFFNVHGFGEGLFMSAVGTQDAPQVVWVGTQQPGGENISGMAVYDEDANIQQTFLRLSFNVNTKEGYGKLSCPSDFTTDDNLHQNQFYVTNDETRLKYYHATSGEIISQKLTDDGILIEKYDSDDDPLSKVVLAQIDYDGNIISPHVATLDFADDTAAAAGGVPLNAFYHNNGAMRIRLV